MDMFRKSEGNIQKVAPLIRTVKKLIEKNEEEAVKILNNLVDKYPYFSLPYYLLAEIYYTKREYFSFKKTIEVLLMHNPYDEPAYKLLLKYAEELNDKELKDKCNSIIEFLEGKKKPVAEKRIPFVTKSVAELYESQGYLKEALSIYERLLSLNPEDAEIKKKIDELKRRIENEEKNI